MRLCHAADIHLGRLRLDGRLPDHDLARAFRHVAEAAVAERADVFLLAGDLFDRPQVEPGHLRQAQEILQILYAAKIPVVAIEGNHDKTFVHSDAGTWVGFLAQDGLLQLLRPEFGPDGAILAPWDASKRRGAFVDHGGLRFVGAGYLGAATPAKVRQIVAALDPSTPHVMLLHAGPDYFVGEGGGFSKADLAAIRERVAYLALGHIHKPKIYDGWACNPGSPENCDLREASYSFGPDGLEVGRGYGMVEIDLAQPGQPVRIQIRSNPRRPVYQATLDCTAFGNKLKEGEAALIKAALKVIEPLACRPEGVIELRLTGYLNLKRIALDQAELSVEIARASAVFAVALDASQLNLGEACGEGGPASDEGLTREELERQAIRKIAGQEPLWGLFEQQEAFATLFFDVKEAVRTGAAAETIAELISANSLVDRIQAVEALRATAQETQATDGKTLPEIPS